MNLNLHFSPIIQGILVTSQLDSKFPVKGHAFFFFFFKQLLEPRDIELAHKHPPQFSDMLT